MLGIPLRGWLFRLERGRRVWTKSQTSPLAKGNCLLPSASCIVILTATVICGSIVQVVIVLLLRRRVCVDTEPRFCFGFRFSSRLLLLLLLLLLLE